MDDTRENRRSLTANLANWRAYERLLKSPEQRGKRIIPIGGMFYSPEMLGAALGVLDAVKRDSVMRFYVDGESQSDMARKRDVSQTLVWYEIDSGVRKVLEALG